MELSYISQGIVYVLALMGILFKSTQTDSDGKTIYWKHSVPLLTPTGKMVVVLITLSSVIAIISAHKRSLSDSHQREIAEANQKATADDLKIVQGQNAALHQVIVDVAKQGELLTKEQREQFTSVLSEQKQSGQAIATEIGSSAGLLKGRIENSIDLLHRSTTEIDRAVNPINNVLVSFDISPPQVSAISEYQDKVVNELKASDPNRLPDGVTFADRGINGEVLTYDIDPKSRLFPRGDSLPYSALNYVGIKIEFRVVPDPIIVLKNGGTPPDLVIYARANIENRGAKENPKAMLRYDVKRDRVRITAFYVPSDPNTWNRRNDKVTSIPDMLKSQVVIRFFQWVFPQEQARALEELYANFEFDRVWLQMSGGRGFEFVGNTLKPYKDRNGRNFYLASFPPESP